MSITFYNNVDSNWKEKLTPCYCAERNSCEDDEMQSFITDVVLDRASDEEKISGFDKLKDFAQPDCELCHGEGSSQIRDWNPTININWSNANCYAILRLLGVKEDDLPSGSMTLPEIRRALLKALNSDVSKAVRSEEIIHGKPREISPGVTEMRPLRMFDSGLSQHDIKDRLDKLTKFVAMSIEQGATEIYWS